MVLLASKISHMKMENLDSNLMCCWKDPIKRISALEDKIDHIQSSVENPGVLKKAESNPLVCSFHDLQKGNTGEEEKDERHPFDWPLMTSYNRVQKERDSLDHEVTFLHSELFQAKFTLKQLEKAYVKLQSKLLANRAINEDLSLELAFLKPNLRSSEENITGLEAEKRELTLRIKNLKEEREQLLSQKKLLIKTLTSRKDE
ncbi:uncharacterized protein LOC126065850 isoform X2 [Elephas maximus indicus]|uniref:uncharacterized protein LOC126065850 isoform X2 n=1 Tax=Elephas maximus indicus TaxID=99487 RepID=UPI0021166CDB|nr:uncharacterized protein LOC126065850 isoform X2 [Elephas maximus indicus]